MFSVIDSGTQRFLATEAYDRAGRRVHLQVSFPGGRLSPALANRLKTDPDQASMQVVANTLLITPWVPSESRKEDMLNQLRAENPDAPVLRKPEGGAAVETIYRLVTNEDTPTTRAAAIELSSVHVSAWRLIFDQRGLKIRAEPLGLEAKASRAP